MSIEIWGVEMPKTCGECFVKEICFDTPFKASQSQAFKDLLLMKKPDFCLLREREVTAIKTVKRHKMFYTGKVCVNHELEHLPSEAKHIKWAEKNTWCERKDSIEERPYCAACKTWLDDICELNIGLHS